MSSQSVVRKVVKIEKVGSSWKPVNTSDAKPIVARQVEKRKDPPASTSVALPKHVKAGSMLALAMRRATPTDDWEDDEVDEEEEEEEDAEAEEWDEEWDDDWDNWQADAVEPAPKRPKTEVDNTYPDWKPPLKLKLDLSQTFSGVVNKRVSGTDALLIDCAPVTQAFKRPAIIPEGENHMFARIGSCVIFKVSQDSDGAPVATDIIINGFEEIDGAETITWEEELAEAERAREAAEEVEKAKKLREKTEAEKVKGKHSKLPLGKGCHGKSKASSLSDRPLGKGCLGKSKTNGCQGKSKTRTTTDRPVGKGCSGKVAPWKTEKKIDIAPWKAKQSQGTIGGQSASGNGKSRNEGLSPAAAALAQRLAASKGQRKG